MRDYLVVLAIATLPAIGNFLGGVLSEAVHVSQRILSFALHLAAGIVFAVVGIELMPEALTAEPAWLVILAFVAGGGFFMVVEKIIDVVQKRRGGDPEKTGPWVILFGVAVDLFSDGVMIGTGSTISVGLGLLLALGQVPADVPEGFATIATFKKQGVPRRRRLLLAASLMLPIFIGATVGFWAVRGQPDIVKMSLLAFTAGILTTVVVEEIVPLAHEGEEARGAVLALVGGFALFALLSVSLGG